MEHDLGRRLKIGAVWSYFQSGGMSAIHFITGVIMARLLEPEDFGVFIAVAAYTAILSSQVYFGIPKALQREKELDVNDINISFWFMQCIAALAFLCAFVLSGYIERIYEGNSYSDIMRLMSLTFFYIPFSACISTLMKRDLDFRNLSLLRIKAAVLSLPLPIVLAATGYGPFSLALGGLTSVTINMYLFSRHHKWRPGRPSIRGVGKYIRYAGSTHLNGTLTIVMRKVDVMLIGGLLNAGLLGLYNRAFSLSRMPVEQIALNLQSVVFSGLVKLKDDVDKSSLMSHKILCSLSLFVFPILLLLILIAEEFITLVYGMKWAGAATPMKIMAIGAFATLVNMVIRSISAAHNMVVKEIPISITGVLLTVTLVALLAPFGLDAVAAGIAVREWLIFAMLLYLVKTSSFSLDLLSVLKAVWPAIVICLFALVFGETGGWIAGEIWMDSMVIRMLLVILFFTGGYLLSFIVLNRYFRSHVEYQAAIGMFFEIGGKIPVMRNILLMIDSRGMTGRKN